MIRADRGWAQGFAKLRIHSSFSVFGCRCGACVAGAEWGGDRDQVGWLRVLHEKETPGMGWNKAVARRSRAEGRPPSVHPV